MLTKDARDVLPEDFSYKHAVSASAVSNVLVAALMTQNWPLVGEMMNKDLFHQPYRTMLVPELSKVEHVASLKGAYGTALSGAGPTILTLVEKGRRSAERAACPKLPALRSRFADGASRRCCRAALSC